MSSRTAHHVLTTIRTKPIALSTVVYAAVTIVCARIPLFDYLGYEFSFVMSIAGTLLAGLTTIGRVRTVDPGDRIPPDVREGRVLREFFATLAASLLVLIIPLALISANALFVKNCSWLEGLAFFLLLPPASVVVASALGLLCAVHYRHPRTLFLVWVSATVLYAVAVAYVSPAIFSYNPFYGYFPGLTYDEIIEITPTFILSRVLALMLAGVFVWLSVLLLRHVPADVSGPAKGVRLLEILVRPSYRWVTLGIVLCLSMVYAFRCELGLESTAAFIRRSLGGEYRTDRVVIYYSRESMTGEEVRRIAAEHEFQLQSVLDAFALMRTGQVTSYVYPDERVKRRLMGAGITTIARPWNGEVHVAQQAIDATLKHELVHVVAAEFGFPVIRASVTPGLVEGLAMAVEWNWANRTLHQYAAAMKATGTAPDIARLMSPAGFTARAASVSYVLCGSFCRYLIDRYGIRLMAQVYATAAFERVYGRPLDQLVREWQAFLDGVDPGPRPGWNTDAWFRRPPIFGKVCARVMARRNEEARHAIARRDYEGARRQYALMLGETGAFEAVYGYLLASHRLGRHAVVAGFVDSLLGTTAHPGMFLPMYLLGADARWAMSIRSADPDSEAYHRGLAQTLAAVVRDADWTEQQSEGSRIRLLALDDPVAASAVVAYLLSDGGDSVRLRLLDSACAAGARSPVVQYLRGRNLQRIGDVDRALEAMDSVSFTGADEWLEACRLRTTGILLARLGRYEEARVRFWTSLNHEAAPAVQNRVNEWVNRCEWMERHGI